MANGQKVRELELVRIPETIIKVTVEGVTPFLSHCFAPLIITEMEEKKEKKAKAPRGAKNPERQFRLSLYPANGTVALADWENSDYLDQLFGIPALHFKQAMVQAGRVDDARTMAELKQLLWVEGDVLPIRGSVPRHVEHVVRIARGVADLRHRGQFDEWQVDLGLHLTTDALSPEEALQLLQLAGRVSGVGDWRPQRGGDYGRFKIVGTPELWRGETW